MVRWQIAAVLGLMASVAVTGAALVAERSSVEADVGGRAKAALSGEALSWASTEVDGRDVVLAGAAPSEDLRTLAVERLGRLFGVRSIDTEQAGLLPEAAPYAVKLERKGHVLTISGTAPSQPDRSRMVAGLAAAVPNLAYNDRLRLARGMPDAGYLDTLTALYPVLASFDEGRVTLTDRAVKIEGEAWSNGAYDALARFAPALPRGYEIERIAVTRPRAAPFQWSAEKTSRGVRLAGFLPDPETRDRLFGLARRGAGQHPIRDDADLASGAPAGFADAAAGAADLLDLIAEGRIEIEDGTLAINGRATSPETYRQAQALLAEWKPAGFVVAASVDLPVVSPFTLSASRNGKKLTVSGFVPSDAVADEIKTASQRIAGFDGAVVETTLAGGAPEGFEAAAQFAVRMLEHVSTGAAVISDKTITLSGEAKTGSDLLEVEATATTEPPEGFTVNVALTPPVVSPYLWSMRRTEDALEITGYVPSEALRTAVREAAEERSGDLAVADRSSLAAGLPNGIDLAVVAAFATEQAAHLTKGHVSLNGDTLSILGEADDARDGMAAVAAMEGKLPQGVKKGIVQVEFPRDFHLRIERGLDAVAVEGTVADPAMRAAVEEAISRGFGRADLVLSLEEMPGLPDAATDAAVLAIRAASLLATGTVTVENTVITVQGKAFTGTGAVRFSSEIASNVPKGYRLDTAIGVARSGPKATPAECGQMIGDILARNGVHFDGATVAADSHGLLDRIGSVAERCPEAKLAIAGRADAGGDPAVGSERAKAVSQFLADVGIDPARLEVKETGTGAPATNDTAPAGGTEGGLVSVTVETGAPAP